MHFYTTMLYVVYVKNTIIKIYYHFKYWKQTESYFQIWKLFFLMYCQ